MRLTNEQLWSIPINTAALQMADEALAREQAVLPVAVDGDELRLVLPAFDDLKLMEFEDRLRFILERRFTYDVADPEELARVVEFHYNAAGSTVANCDRTFQFRCPRQWASLQATDSPAVRWCHMCQRRVTYCLRNEDAERLSRAGERVAFFDNATISELMTWVVEEEA